MAFRTRRMLMVLDTDTEDEVEEKRRRYSVHPLFELRSTYGEFHHLYQDLRQHQERFFEFMRMSVETFDFKTSKKLQNTSKLQRKITCSMPITAAERLYVTLRYLSTGISFAGLANQMRMGKTTIGKIVQDTCKVIWSELVDEFMPIPTKQKLAEVAKDFYVKWQFPNCIGAIDGKHFQIKAPKHSGSMYFNYLKYFSIVLQAVADADKKFITVEIGGREKQSDGGTFAASTLFQLLESGNFNVPESKSLPGTNIVLPHVLIGDEAYPLKPYLMRPFPSRQLTPMKENFNNRLSTATKCVECAFGILRAKWRILGKDIEQNPEHAYDTIKSVCILHNVIRDRDGNNDLHYNLVVNQIYHEENDEVEGERGGIRNTEESRAIRDNFAEYFLHN